MRPLVLVGEILHFRIVTTTRVLTPAALCPLGMFTFNDEKPEEKKVLMTEVQSIRGRFLLTFCSNQWSSNVTKKLKGHRSQT